MSDQRGPQQPNQYDPFELWRQFYEANEQAWTKAIKDMTSTQAYAEAQGRMLEVFLSYQKMVRDAMSTQLTAFNLPTREDVANLGELIVNLEEKVDKLDESVAQLNDRLAAMEKRAPRGSEEQPAERAKPAGRAAGRSSGQESADTPK
jgi:polyhydroxyalkanoic acid synthase PhaR subunit